ncbi:MAG: amidohydrolase family protein [Acidimicrobiales bacterium]
MIRLGVGATPCVVVDAHAHLGAAAVAGDDGGRVAALLAHMDAAGVDRACVFASAGRGSGYPEETDLLVRAAARTGGRIVPFARVHPFWGTDAEAALRRAAEDGVQGLKLHPFMDGAFMANDATVVHPLLRVAAEYGLVVLVHSGWGWNSAPGLVADLARSFPAVTVIMGHAGRYGFHREAAVVGRDLPNLHFDVAGLATPSAVDELAAAVGPDRVLFGSDHPYTPVGFELEKVARWSTFGPDDVALMVGGNATRLLGLDPDGAAPIRDVPKAGDSTEEVRP